MTEPSDPRVVLEAHALRTRAVRRAVVHGSGAGPSQRSLLPALAASGVLTVVMAVAVTFSGRLMELLGPAGH